MILAAIPRIDTFLMDKPNPFEQRYFMFEQYRTIFDELGIPLASITNTEGIEEFCDVCAGLVLPGSSKDIFPEYYGRERLEGKKYEIDEYKVDRLIVEQFVKKNKPIFGICGGLQTLNVYFGGTLKQKIEGHDCVDHSIVIDKDSLLYRAYGKESAIINSYHCQAIDDLAPGFRITATAEDGTIEAIEKGNIVAFQWHPEVMLDTKLFKKFVEEFF